MGERATGLIEAPGPDTSHEAPSASTREAARQLQADIVALREDLGGLVGELDRRRHELTNVGLQLRRHAGAAALTGVALVATAGGMVWLGIWRARRRATLASRAGRLREAVGRMVDRPERVAAEQTVPGKIVTAAATAALATLVRKALEMLIHATLQRVSPGAPRQSIAIRPAGRPADVSEGAPGASEWQPGAEAPGLGGSSVAPGHHHRQHAEERTLR